MPRTKVPRSPKIQCTRSTSFPLSSMESGAKVVPGMRLFSEADDYKSGPGTYALNGGIFASLVGKLLVSEEVTLHSKVSIHFYQILIFLFLENSLRFSTVQQQFYSKDWWHRCRPSNSTSSKLRCHRGSCH